MILGDKALLVFPQLLASAAMSLHVYLANSLYTGWGRSTIYMLGTGMLPVNNCGQAAYV